jgi:malonyl-CoA/methylmalonyl-CoA synthetase
MIEVRGPNVFKGYWRMPEKTAAEFAPDGFFITGDLGKIDERGYVHIVGRGKDLIITGGYNVYPKEVETRSTPWTAWSRAPSSACRIPISARASRRSVVLRPARRSTRAITRALEDAARPLQAAQARDRRRRVAAQHHGQGAEEPSLPSRWAG